MLRALDFGLRGPHLRPITWSVCCVLDQKPSPRSASAHPRIWVSTGKLLGKPGEMLGVNPCNGPASNLGEEQWYSWLAHDLETMISSGWVGHFAPVQTFEAQHRLHTDIFNFALSLIAIIVPILSIIFYFQRLEVFKMWFNRKFVDELNWWYNFVRQEIFWWLV